MCPSYTTEYATYGGMIMGSEVPAANCFVLWVCNASQSTPNILSPQIIRARKNRAKLIVVAPRKTREAGKADIWLQIRPGTDQALMLGWIPLIIKEQLYDQDFVSRYTVGFAELEEAVESYTPAKVAEITSIPEELVVQGARMPQEQKGKQLGADMYPFLGIRVGKRTQRQISNYQKATWRLPRHGTPTWPMPERLWRPSSPASRTRSLLRSP